MKKELENAPPEPREPEAREWVAALENKYGNCCGDVIHLFAEDMEREVTRYSAELRAERDAAIKLRDEYLEWANCGGCPTKDVCSSPDEPGHEIYGPYFANGDGTFTCSIHRARENEAKLEAAEASLLQARLILKLAVSQGCNCWNSGEDGHSRGCFIPKAEELITPLASTSAPEGEA